MQAKVAAIVMPLVLLSVFFVVNQRPVAFDAHRTLEERIAPLDMRAADANDVVQQYCVRCHSDRRMTGNLSLEDFDFASVLTRAETAERMCSNYVPV